MSHMPSTNLGFATKIVNVRDYGAVGDGTTNDAAAIVAANTAAAALSGGVAYGATVYFPKGTYRINSQFTIPNGVNLLGAGPSATVIKATNTFNAASMITNAGFQEFTFIEGMTIDGNKGGGAVCSTAVVNLTSMFINSYMRDVVVQNGSNVGLRVAAESDGMGPFLIENCWVLSCNGHNVLIEETGANTGAVNGILCINLTSEHQASNKSAIYLKGLGHCQQWNLINTHIEMGTAATGRTGITIDGVSHVLIDGVQLLADAATVSAGITIANVAQNVGIQIRGVTNENLINPVLNDAKNSFSVGALNVPRYYTPDIHFVGPQAFDGNVTIGDAVTDAHTINGTTTVNETVGTIIAGSNPCVDLVDTTSQALGVGGSLRFQGAYTGSTTTSGAEIKAAKTNGTDGNFSFDLLFGTRPNGGSVTEAFRLKDDQSAVFAGHTRTTNEVAPAQITSNQNDYSPTGMASAAVLVVNSDAARDITGIATGANGRWLWVYNNGAQNITLKHQDANSTATNRLIGTAGADVVLTPARGCALYYSPSQSRWLVMVDNL